MISKPSPILSTMSSPNSATFIFEHSKLPSNNRWNWTPKLEPKQVLIYDGSWSVESSQPRLILAWQKGKKKFASAKLDINDVNAFSVSSQEALGIPKYLIKKSKVNSVRIQRGHGDKNAIILPVLGETFLNLKHAKGRNRRQKSKIEEEDLKNLSIKTLIVPSFPSYCKYNIIAGEDFLDLNLLQLDNKHDQLLNKRGKTFIQFADPSRATYQDTHSCYWLKHSVVPKSKQAKPKLPKFCNECEIKIKNLDHVDKPKFEKGERVSFHFALKDSTDTISGLVSGYSNSHLISIKIPSKKLLITVPECTVTKEGTLEPPLKYKTREKPQYTRDCNCLEQGFPNHSLTCVKLAEQPRIFRTISKPSPNLSISPMVSTSIPASTLPAFSDIQSEFEIGSDEGHFDRVNDWVDTTLNKEAEEVPMHKPDSPEVPQSRFPAINLMKEVTFPSLPKYAKKTCH